MLLAAEVEQAVQPFLGPGRGVDEPIVHGDRPGEDLEQRDLADELVGDGLEHVGQWLAGCVGGHLDLDPIGAGAGEDGHRTFGWGWAQLADEVEQTVDADARRGRADEHGELGSVQDLVGQGLLQLGG